MADKSAEIAERAGQWSYSINHGPDGEQNYANVYDSDERLVGNLCIHHAVAVVASMNMLPLDWMRIGARAARLSAGAQCGNHWESAQEDAMTSSGLSPSDKQKLYAEANAAEEIRKQIDGTCEDSALGYASYMGTEADKAALAAEGVTSNWLYRKQVGVSSRMESVE